MAVIKLVTNGDSTNQFRAVSLGHVVAVVFGLCSIIGGQQTWLWAGAHERSMIITQIKTEIAEDQRLHDARDDSRFKEIDRRLDRLELSMESAQRQISLNTGRIETGHK
jgi:hypothetical protein